MTSIDNPILNPPYEQPDRYYEVGPQGPTGEVKEGRRPSESFIPIAVTRKGRKGQGETVQESFDFDATGERREKNSLINDVRRDVAKWRRGGEYAGVTPISRKLLQYWADPDRENRVIFAQREAAETAIFLTEVAGRTHGYADWRKRLEPQNELHNAGLPRAALKMATGSGKTVVMAMLIAWQTLNKVQSPRDARFTNRFLIVAPGITIRDRLRVLLPQDTENYYDLRDLIPVDLRGGLEHARIVITNYHVFQLKDAKEIKGVAKNTRLLLRGDRKGDPFKETPQAMVSRVLRDLGADKQQVFVLNDEAHHCYMDRPLPAGEKAAIVFGHSRDMCGHSAVDRQRRARGGAGRWRGQERDRCGHLVGRYQPPVRLAGFERGAFRRRVRSGVEQPPYPGRVGGAGVDGLTRMPSARRSAAIASVSDSTAPLLAEYSARCGNPAVAAIEQVLTIAACADARRAGSVARVTRTNPRMFTSRTRCHSASSLSATPPCAPIPALLTSTSSPPSACTAAVTAERTAASSVTSARL